MSLHPGWAKNDELADVARRLIDEYADFPPGSVLRCLSRAVAGARSWGCPPQFLASTAEGSTRWMLAQRRNAAEDRTPAVTG